MRIKLNRKGVAGYAPTILAAALALAITFTFNACSGDNNGNNSLPPEIIENSSSSNDGGDVNPPDDNLMPCGGGFFNSAYQFCANDKVYDLCSGIGYNPANYICCNNAQYDINTYGCCNNKQYNFTLQFCNENNVLNKCGGEEYSPVNQRCENNVIENKCGSNWYKPLTQFCNGNNILDKCGVNEYNPATHYCHTDGITYSCDNKPLDPAMQFCDGNNILDKCDGNEYNFTYQRCENGIIEDKCGSNWYNPLTQFCHTDYKVYPKCNENYNPSEKLCDARDKKLYKHVTIGWQVWMAENLNYDINTNSNKCYNFGDYLYCGRGSVCYNISEANCNKYGRLYDWVTAITACPEGWHLPSDAEWTTLINYAGGDTRKLKTINSWNYSSYSNGTDYYGFAALPGGKTLTGSNSNNENVFSSVGNEGNWWSSTESNSSAAYYFGMSYNSNFVEKIYTGKWYELSVRCVHD
jgi:uncharacterized protein (TIGR02145 family)